MRSLGIPVVIVSTISAALFIAAIVVQNWHTYQNFDSRTVRFGLSDICFGDKCHDCLFTIFSDFVSNP